MPCFISQPIICLFWCHSQSSALFDSTANHLPCLISQPIIKDSIPICPTRKFPDYKKFFGFYWVSSALKTYFWDLRKDLLQKSLCSRYCRLRNLIIIEVIYAKECTIIMIFHYLNCIRIHLQNISLQYLLNASRIRSKSWRSRVSEFQGHCRWRMRSLHRLLVSRRNNQGKFYTQNSLHYARWLPKNYIYTHKNPHCIMSGGNTRHKRAEDLFLWHSIR